MAASLPMPAILYRCGKIGPMALHVSGGGTGEPTLLLLHGLGATGEVWRGLVEHWPGSWLAPDLPGHGRSDPLPRYSFGGLAAAVAGSLEPGARVAVLGHSLGGAIGLTLASGWVGVTLPGGGGVGVKVRREPSGLAQAAHPAGPPGPGVPPPG